MNHSVSLTIHIQTKARCFLHLPGIMLKSVSWTERDDCQRGLGLGSEREWTFIKISMVHSGFKKAGPSADNRKTEWSTGRLQFYPFKLPDFVHCGIWKC